MKSHCHPIKWNSPSGAATRSSRCRSEHVAAKRLSVRWPQRSLSNEAAEPCPPHPTQVLDDITANGTSGESWNRRWLDILKRESEKGFHPELPPYGFGDPLSYSCVRSTSAKVRTTGAVRHGAECFNYYFPQELDDEYLVMWTGFANKKQPTLQYMNEVELRSFLSRRVEDGFTFPLNPKWVLCDSGWYPIFSSLCKTSDVSAWYPPSSGLVESIEAIHDRFPDGIPGGGDRSNERFLDIDLAWLELDCHIEDIANAIEQGWGSAISTMTTLSTAVKEGVGTCVSAIQDTTSAARNTVGEAISSVATGAAQVLDGLLDPRTSKLYARGMLTRAVGAINVQRLMQPRGMTLRKAVSQVVDTQATAKGIPVAEAAVQLLEQRKNGVFHLDQATRTSILAAFHKHKADGSSNGGLSYDQMRNVLGDIDEELLKCAIPRPAERLAQSLSLWQYGATRFRLTAGSSSASLMRIWTGRWTRMNSCSQWS